jgi:DNA polymerase III epsilon subunit-like protein
MKKRQSEFLFNFKKRPKVHLLKISHISFKWPKLTEAYRHCYDRDFDGAHDALADVRATADVFRWLVSKGHYKLPAAPKKEELCQTTT